MFVAATAARRCRCRQYPLQSHLVLVPFVHGTLFFFIVGVDRHCRFRFHSHPFPFRRRPSPLRSCARRNRPFTLRACWVAVSGLPRRIGCPLRVPPLRRAVDAGGGHGGGEGSDGSDVAGEVCGGFRVRFVNGGAVAAFAVAALVLLASFFLGSSRLGRLGEIGKVSEGVVRVLRGLYRQVQLVR